jgi:two-component system KDP operon response regulator KdpE
VQLTPTGFRRITCRAAHLGMVVTRRQFSTGAWGPAHGADTHYLRIDMKQLRDKFDADPVQPRHFITETGVGYRRIAGDSPESVPDPSSRLPARRRHTEQRP